MCLLLNNPTVCCCDNFEMSFIEYSDTISDLERSFIIISVNDFANDGSSYTTSSSIQK